jgi:beta-lactamase class A
MALMLQAVQAGTNSVQTMNNSAFAESRNLQLIVDGAVRDALEKLTTNKLTADQFAMTLVDLNVSQPAAASYRGREKIYPASVIKLFYLVAAHRWMEDGRLKDTEELRRAMRDMIVDSSNEATGLVVDSLTETTSGPEMSPEELERWHEKRNAVNRYFVSLGYTDINANRKPWNDGPYGRERQSVLAHSADARNMLTTDATAQLMTEIMTGLAIAPERCNQMKELLRRDLAETKTEGQVKGFIGETLPAGSTLWSKAGWMSQARHDCAAFELPDGRKFVLVIFTVGHANEPEVLQTLSRSVITELTNSKNKTKSPL